MLDICCIIKLIEDIYLYVDTSKKHPKVSLVVSVSVSGLYLLTLLKVFYLIPRVLSRLMIKLLEIFGNITTDSTVNLCFL